MPIASGHFLFALLTLSRRSGQMAALTLYEELEKVLTSRMKNALRTDETIIAADWVTDIAEVLALPVCMVETDELPSLRKYAHAELDRRLMSGWPNSAPRATANIA